MNQEEMPLAGGSVFLISEDDIERIASNRARANNDIAYECNQEKRLAASDLVDMYYKQRGCCSWCASRLTVDIIQLDHIEEKNLRAARAAAKGKESGPFGSVADINNVQWVCRACNSLKEFLRRNSLEIAGYLESVASECRKGFPIRSQIVIAGNAKTKKVLREEFLANLFASKGNSLTVNEACNALTGTGLEACESQIHKSLRAIGWRGVSERVASKLRAIKTAVEKGPRFMKSKADWYRFFCQFTAGEQTSVMSSVRFHQLVEQHSIVLPVSENGESFRSRTNVRRSPTAADKQAVLAAAKQAGIHGISEQDIHSAVESSIRPAEIVSAAISELAEIGRLQPAQKTPGRFVYSLDRDEAAQMLGVSRHRLKKWATRNWDYLSDRPDFFKATDKPKGRCFYAIDRLHGFMANRRQHPLDLVKAGKRPECVAGGRLGGRPLAGQPWRGPGCSDRQPSRVLPADSSGSLSGEPTHYDTVPGPQEAAV